MKLTTIFENINKDLQFISGFRDLLNQALSNVNVQLNKYQGKYKTDPRYPKLKLVNYSDLKDWSPKIGKSEALTALYHKINHMVYDIGSPNSVLPMLERICRGTKRQKFPKEGEKNEEGHFRWNYKVYILTPDEVEFLKSVIYPQK